MLYPNRFYYWLLLLCLWAGAYHKAQAQNANNWYLSKILNDNNGLPQNSVRSVYYDTATNFLWLATEAGLVRYDGQQARVFDRRDMPWMQSMRIHNLLPTVQGKVIGCNIAGETFELNCNAPQAGSGNYNGPPNDIIYRESNIPDLAGLAIEREALRLQNIGTAGQVSTLWLNDSAWLTSNDSSIFLMQHNRVAYRWPHREEGIPLFISRGKWIYTLTRRGGYCLDIGSKMQVSLTVQSSLLSGGNARFIYNKLNDIPLLLQGNEVHEIVFEENIVSTRLVAILPNMPGSITTLTFDKTRRYLFVATNATGLFIYHLSPFSVYTAGGDNLYNDNYACVLTNGGRSIFTLRSLLFNMDDGTSKLIPAYAGKIQVLATDMAENIYAGLKHEMVRFSLTHPGQVLKISLPKKEELLVTAYRANNNRVWFSTFQQLYFMEGDLMQPLLTYPGVKQSLYFIAETPSGQLLGISQDGIYTVEKTKHQLVPLLQNKELLQARSIWVDSGNRCWIATYGNGLFLYNLSTKKLTHFPTDDKGYLQYGHTFIEDGADNILMPTNKGLFRLSKANLLQIEQAPATPLCYQYFDVNDGLLTNEFNGGCQPAYNRLPGGDVVLPALQGLVRVRIKELPEPLENPLFIDGIETQLKRYDLNGTLHFTSDERVQAWNLSFTRWDRPNLQGIFYRLDGDSNWKRLPVGETQIRLTGLNGGNHLLEIKHQYGFKPEQFTALSCRFSVGRYYYETIWFWFVIAMLLAGVVYVAVRIRSRQLKQKNIYLQQVIRQNTQDLSNKNEQLQETLLELNEALKGLQEASIFKNRLLGLLGHDMLVPLRFIARIANYLHSGAATFSAAETEENSSEIENTATELLYLGESLIQWIKLQEGHFQLIIQPIDLQRLAVEIMQVHRPIAANKNNRLSCNIIAGLLIQYDPILIKVILHNLLLNANKFTSGGVIMVAASVEKNILQMQVTDTGLGMNEKMVNSLNSLIPVQSLSGTHQEGGFGMGYMLIIDLLRFAGGSLEVKNNVEGGTIVAFTLPLG